MLRRNSLDPHGLGFSPFLRLFQGCKTGTRDGWLGGWAKGRKDPSVQVLSKNHPAMRAREGVVGLSPPLSAQPAPKRFVSTPSREAILGF